MAAQPCANHPKEMTYVRCGRCDKPICVRCMVDTPVGKKCRECARSRTHLTVSTPAQVLLALLVGTAVAVPAGWALQQVHIFILAFPFGALVGEVAVRAGGRSRSLGIQIAAGFAALIGAMAGATWSWGPEMIATFNWPMALQPYSLLITGIGVAVAVSRVRFL